MSVEVSIKDLCVTLGGSQILHDVNMNVAAGEFLTLLGPSGSGKTTTLNVLAGFVHRQTGHVAIGGERVDELPAHRRNIGMLFQNYALFPHMTVGRNVEFPLIARKIGRNLRVKLVEQALDLVQLSGTDDRAVRSLSGGQQQRVALARALVFEPKLLLLDEPLAALDKQLRETMQIELKRIVGEAGTTAIAVTHDQTEALTMSDKVAIMRDGRVEQIGTPREVYRQPQTLFVAQFLGEANLLPVRESRVEHFDVASDGRSGIAVLRPEDLSIRAAEDLRGTPARVAEVDFQGSRLRVVAALADATRIIVSGSATDPESAISRGDNITLHCRPGLVPHVIEAVAYEDNSPSAEGKRGEALDGAEL